LYEAVSDEGHELHEALNKLDVTTLGQNEKDIVETLKKLVAYAKRVSLI